MLKPDLPLNVVLTKGDLNHTVNFFKPDLPPNVVLTKGDLHRTQRF